MTAAIKVGRYYDVFDNLIINSEITVIIHKGKLFVCNATCENTHSNPQSSDMTLSETAPIFLLY